MTPTVSNATPEAFSAGVGLLERLQPSLVTRQGGELTSRVWLNGKFRTKPWIQMVPGATQSPPDLIEDEVSDLEASGIDSLREVIDGYQGLRCYISSFNGLDNQMFLLWEMQQGG